MPIARRSGSSTNEFYRSYEDHCSRAVVFLPYSGKYEIRFHGYGTSTSILYSHTASAGNYSAPSYSISEHKYTDSQGKSRTGIKVDFSTTDYPAYRLFYREEGEAFANLLCELFLGRVEPFSNARVIILDGTTGRSCWDAEKYHSLIRLGNVGLSPYSYRTSFDVLKANNKYSLLVGENLPDGAYNSFQYNSPYYGNMVEQSFRESALSKKYYFWLVGYHSLWAEHANEKIYETPVTFYF